MNDKEPEIKAEDELELTEDCEESEQEREQAELSELEILEKKYNELNDKHLRLMAEYDNFRKRTQKEREDVYPSAAASAVAKFLPIIDNFERAAAFPHPDDDFGKGFDMIFQSLKEVLASMKVEEIGAAGETFNPDYHNAVMHIEDEELGENVVVTVLQKGYKIGGKIIRYAMVQTAN